MKEWVRLFSDVVVRAFYGNRNTATPTSQEDTAKVAAPVATPSSATAAAAAPAPAPLSRQSVASSLPPPGTAPVTSPAPPPLSPKPSSVTPKVPPQSLPLPDVPSQTSSVQKVPSQTPPVTQVSIQSPLNSSASSHLPVTPVRTPSQGGHPLPQTASQSAPQASGGEGWTRSVVTKKPLESGENNWNESGQERGRGRGRGRGWGRGRGGKGGSRENSGSWGRPDSRDAKGGQHPQKPSSSGSPNTPNSNSSAPPRPKRPGSWRKWPGAISRSLSPRPSPQPPCVDEDGFTLVQRRNKPGRLPFNPRNSGPVSSDDGGNGDPRYEVYSDPESASFIDFEDEFMLEEEDFPVIESPAVPTESHQPGASRSMSIHNRPDSQESGNRKRASNSNANDSLHSPKKEANQVSSIPKEVVTEPGKTCVKRGGAPSPLAKPVATQPSRQSGDDVGKGAKFKREHSKTGVIVKHVEMAPQDAGKCVGSDRVYENIKVKTSDTSKNDSVVDSKKAGNQVDFLQKQNETDNGEKDKRKQVDIPSLEKPVVTVKDDTPTNATVLSQDKTHTPSQESSTSKSVDTTGEPCASTPETKSKKPRKKRNRKTSKSESRDMTDTSVIHEEIQQMDSSADSQVAESRQSDYLWDHYYTKKPKSRDPHKPNFQADKVSEQDTYRESGVDVATRNAQIAETKSGKRKMGELAPDARVEHDVTKENIRMNDKPSDNTAMDTEDDENNYVFIHMKDVLGGDSTATNEPEDMVIDYNHFSDKREERATGDADVNGRKNCTGAKQKSSSKWPDSRKKHQPEVQEENTCQMPHSPSPMEEDGRPADQASQMFEMTLDKPMKNQEVPPDEESNRSEGAKERKQKNYDKKKAKYEEIYEEIDGKKHRKNKKHRAKKDDGEKLDEKTSHDASDDKTSKTARTARCEEEEQQTVKAKKETRKADQEEDICEEDEDNHEKSKKRHNDDYKLDGVKNKLEQKEVHKNDKSMTSSTNQSFVVTDESKSPHQKQTEEEAKSSSKFDHVRGDSTTPGNKDEITALMDLISEKRKKIQSLQMSLHKTEPPKEPQELATKPETRMEDTVSEQEGHQKPREVVGDRRLSPEGAEAEEGTLWVFEPPPKTSAYNLLNRKTATGEQKGRSNLPEQSHSQQHREQVADDNLEGDIEKKERWKRRDEEKIKHRKEDKYGDEEQCMDEERRVDGDKEKKSKHEKERHKYTENYKQTQQQIQLPEDQKIGREVSQNENKLVKGEKGQKMQEEEKIETQITIDGKERKRKTREEAEEREEISANYNREQNHRIAESRYLDQEKLERMKKEEKRERKRRRREEKERLKQMQANAGQDPSEAQEVLEEAEARRERRRRKRKEREAEELERQKIERKRRDARNSVEEAPEACESQATAELHHHTALYHHHTAAGGPADATHSLDTSSGHITPADDHSPGLESFATAENLETPTEDIETPSESFDTASEALNTSTGVFDTTAEPADSYSFSGISSLALERLRKVNELWELRNSYQPVEETVETSTEVVTQVSESQNEADKQVDDEMKEDTEMKPKTSRENTDKPPQEMSERRRRTYQENDAVENKETVEPVRRRRRRREDDSNEGQAPELSCAEFSGGFQGFNMLKTFEDLVSERRKRRSRRQEESENQESQADENPPPRRRTRKTEDHSQVQDSQTAERIANESSSATTVRRRRRPDEDSSQTHSPMADTSKDYEEIFARRRQRKSQRLGGDSSQIDEDRRSVYHSQDSQVVDSITEADKQYEEIFERRRRIRRMRYAEMHKNDEQQQHEDQSTVRTSPLRDAHKSQPLEKCSQRVGQVGDAEAEQAQLTTPLAPQKTLASQEPICVAKKSSSESDSSDTDSSDSSDTDSSDSSDTDSSDSSEDSKVSVPGHKLGEKIGDEGLPANRDGEEQLSTPSYGSSRYGSSSKSTNTSGVPTVSYRAALTRDLSASQDRLASGYGSDVNRSGYGSGSGGGSYGSRHSSDNKTSNVAALSSKFGDTKPSPASPRVRPTSLATTTNNNAALNATTATTSSNTSLSKTLSPPTTLPGSRLSRDTSRTESGGRSPSGSAYTSRLTSGTNFDRSGYTSDAKSGYGSDLNRSGYGSGYGSGSGNYTNRYSYSRSNSYMKDTEPTSTGSYKPTYSRENSYLGSDTGSGSGWRSRVYGSDADASSTSRTRGLNNSSEQIPSSSTKQDTNIPKDTEAAKPAFKDAINKLSKAAKDDKKDGKNLEALSPNAVRVLPVFSPDDLNLKNKAPADFSSAAESSDDEEQKKNNSRDATTTKDSVTSASTSVTTSSTSTSSTTTSRPLRHLAAVPSLPTKPTTSLSSGLATPPSFKLSSRFSTSTTENLPATSTSSKWLRDKEEVTPASTTATTRSRGNLSVGDNSPKSTSPLPPRSPVLSPNKNTSISPTAERKSEMGIANKECRKSVLNMDISPSDSDAMRRQQEEKREELRRLRRQRGNDDDKGNQRPPTGSIRTRPGPKVEEVGRQRSRGSGSDLSKTSSQTKVLEEEEESSSEEEDRRDKPPVPPSVEKTSSKTKVVERKHSKGKADAMRRSGSMRRFRQSSQTSKTSTSDSSSSDSEEDIPVVTVVLKCRRRQLSRDDALGSSGENQSRPSSRTSPRVVKKGSSDSLIDGNRSRNSSSSNLVGRRSRNNSQATVESGSRNNSSSNLARSRSGNSSRASIGEVEKSKSGSRSSILGDKKLSLGPDIDIGENRRDSSSTIHLKRNRSSHSSCNLAKTKSGDKLRQSGSSIHRAKDKKSVEKSSSSDSESSDSSDDSSESAGEEGQFFSLTKSRSMKKSKSSLKFPVSLSDEKQKLEELGARTSPDGKEHISRTNSDANVRVTSPCDNAENKNDEELEPFFWPVDNTASKTDLTELYKKSNKFAESNKSVSEMGTFEWPSSSPPPSKTRLYNRSPYQDNTENDAPQISASRSSSKANIDKSSSLEPFEWPSGSPELPRKKLNATVDSVSDLGTFEWPSGSPELFIAKKAAEEKIEGLAGEQETQEEGSAFVWPEGSPELPRRAVYRNTYESETETELLWSDENADASKSPMPKVAEETEEEEYNFEWPSSPELSRRKPCPYGYSDAYDTQAETEEAFDWPSSPDMPRMKNPKFISFTEDIDTLLSNGVEDNFDEMEKLMGYSPPVNDKEAKAEIETVSEDATPVGKKQEETPVVEDTQETAEEKKKSLKERARRNLSLFIGKLTNIDEILGTVLQPLASPVPAPKATAKKPSGEKSEDEDSIMEEVAASDVKVHDAKANRAHIEENLEEYDASAVVVREKRKREALRAEIISAVKAGLDDATLQVYRDGDYGTYLDLESSLAEQTEDIDGLTDSKKNAIILRTQLSVRVHAIIEKLLNSEGRELRRALFSLKQIFQDDKDLVHAFVQNDGLTCLIKVGSSADQNYQNYILRALGQVMLYVDGMNGVMEHQETIQWLYSLISSKYRLVVKTALKLLLVFVEYTESNAIILVNAIETIDSSRGDLPWTTIMRLLEGRDSLDMELLTYAMTLVNKTLNGIPDQDTYYDQTDYLEEQDIETLIAKYMHRPDSDLDLLQQFTIYEAVLAYEDGDDICRTCTIDPSIRQVPRICSADRDSIDRRKSRRHHQSPSPSKMKKGKKLGVNLEDGGGRQSSSDEDHVTVININGESFGIPQDDLSGVKHADAGVTPALRRRRERAERHRTFINEQEIINETRRSSQSSDNNVEDENRKNSEMSGLNKQASWMMDMMYGKREDDGTGRRESLSNIQDIASRISCLQDKENVDNNMRLPIEINAEASVRELQDKMINSSTGQVVTDSEKQGRKGDISDRINKIKDGLSKTHSKGDIKDGLIQVPEPPKKSENDIQWELLIKHLNRPLALCDLDFTDLTVDDDTLMPETQKTGVPPPPPPPPMGAPPPPPPPSGVPLAPPAPPAPPPLTDASQNGLESQDAAHLKPQKTKKTIKLFWKEVREDPRMHGTTIWDKIEHIHVDTQKLEHLFESRAKDIIAKEKQQEQKGVKELIVLDPKRSNVINIGMTKLPPPRTIKTAILKMDSSIINREGIEKLLTTMLPTPEEKHKIQEAAISNPELPLGSAEQFLMMLSSISELPARLKLWIFKLDYENMEKEVAEPLMDLKQGTEDLQKNRTFKIILSVLLSVGNFLNGTECRGFQIEYLSKVPEVKDTVHKHSLLHHLCHMVIEKYSDTSDLYSEIGSITRASKVDFEELASNIDKMEVDCKASWDHLKAIAKHDGPTQIKLKMSEFLADCAERIIVLGIIYRRIMTRFQRFLIWLGSPTLLAQEVKVQQVCSVISEFALEYRTCRERVLQQIQKKANHRERNKTRGKMIMEMEKFKRPKQTKEEKADSDLRQLLNYSDVSDTETIRGKNTWRRTRESKTRSRGEESMTEMMGDGDDALLDSLVKTATQGPSSRSTPRERKRSRHADRKSLRRTLKNGLTEEEKRLLAMIAAQTR